MNKRRIRCVQIRTKNPSAFPLRGKIFVPGRSIVRLGSQTPTEQAFPRSYKKYPITELNTVESILNSRDKLRMKQCFKQFQNEIPQAEWWEFKDISKDQYAELPYPLIAKRIIGFKGHGMFLIQNEQELINNISLFHNNSRFLEHFYNFSREYRLHCTQDECFMAWRKLRKENVKERWFFNSQNCNWINPQHKLFDKPSNWDKILISSIEAIRAVGLDIGAVDVRIQSSKYKEPAYIICEVNSAPALGNQGIQVYQNIIYKLLLKNK